VLSPLVCFNKIFLFSGTSAILQIITFLTSDGPLLISSLTWIQVAVTL
jgi:hypothetical protein